MKMRPTILNIGITIAFLFFLKSSSFYGQGCSDAGACSIGSLDEPLTEFEEVQPSRISLSFDQTFGLGEKFVFISQSSLTVEHTIFKNTTYLVRVPFIFTSGNLGNSSGIGDVLISVMQQVYKENNSLLGFLGGVRLPSNKANFSFTDSPLPMTYQTSLGTYDIIVGGQYLWKSWDFYMAYQHPFNRNENEYLNSPLETDEGKIYFESAKLKRGDDLAFRVQKTFGLKKQQDIMAGAMAIYRIQKSEIVRADQNVVLDNSSGLTLNLYLTYTKKLKGNGLFFLTAAVPVIARDYRADGLTRNFVLSLRFTQLW